MNLRPARLADAPAMARLSRDLIESGLAWRYTPPRMAALIADRDTAAVVADGRADERADDCGDDTAARARGVRGFAVMQFGDTHAHLTLLCVQPSCQRQGLGRGLIAWLLASARVAGIESIRLELRDDNAAALAFYRQLGFTQTQWVPAYYDARIAARRMTLQLRTARA